MRIIFQGDSITDVGRNTERGSLISIGQGYPLMVTGDLGARYPGKFEFINRGVSGNRIVDVYARIKADVWNLEPDVLSILIGVNDVWHEIGDRNGVDADKFERIYSMLLDELLCALPETQFLILEPFVTHGRATDGAWETFSTQVPLRAAAAKRVAQAFSQTFVPLQEVFDKAQALAPAEHWTMDGVHPTVFGHELIAREWVKAFESLK